MPNNEWLAVGMRLKWSNRILILFGVQLRANRTLKGVRYDSESHNFL
jgi:hypothetical protein